MKGVALAMMGLISVCGCKKQEALELPPPVVTVTKAIEKQVQDWDEYTGRLAPMGTVDVRPRVSGYITEVKFVDGDLVKKGQPLFIIDPRPYQADYDQAKAELDKADAALKLASADFDRARQLRDKGVTAAGRFRSAGRHLSTGHRCLPVRPRSARSGQAESGVLHRDGTDRRPSRAGQRHRRKSCLRRRKGSIDDDRLNESQSTPMPMSMSVRCSATCATTRARKKGPEDADEVKIPIEFSLQDEEGFPHTGYIDFLDNRVDPSTGTIRIRGVFDFENGLLGPGLFVRVRIPAGLPYNAILVPERCVASDQGQKYVVVVNEGQHGRVSTGRTRHAF